MGSSYKTDYFDKYRNKPDDIINKTKAEIEAYIINLNETEKALRAQAVNPNV